MAHEEENCHQLTQVLTEHKNLDSESTECSQTPSLRPKDKSSEKTIIFDTAAKNLNSSEQKRYSEPLPQHGSSKIEGKKCFERRRLWTKQDSFDLPDDLKCATEDNVFVEGGRSRQEWRGKVQYQRSLSVPAMLPDLVPERNSRSENKSPDVVTFNKDPKPDHQPVKSILSTASSADRELMLEEKEKKKNFEGAVHCEPMSLAQEIKRKRSVTFETLAQEVKIWSPKGIQARSHFLSSGYGSQSDHSQASQGSNMSSDRGSIFADDIVVDKGSFDMSDSSQADHLSSGNTIIDGNIDDTEEEKDRDKRHEETAQIKKEHNCSASSSGRSPQTSKPQTPEELDETEIWRRLNNPDFHYGDMDDIPNLSIFEMTKENSGTLYFDMHSQNASESPKTEDHTLPPLSPDKLPRVLGSRRNSRILDGESSESKSSPTTKEECQRELYKRLFEERMLQFDPSKESIGDLFEWVKKNIGEAFSPSPKSPFFPADRSPQNELFKISPGLVAVTSGNALQQGLGMPSGVREYLCVPDIIANPAAPYRQPTGNAHPNASQLIPNPRIVPQTNFPQNRPPPGLRNPGVPLSQYLHPGSGPGLNPQVRDSQQQQPTCPAQDMVDGRGRGTEWTGWPGDQTNRNSAVRYQQDLPATLEDVMSSLFISSGSDMSASLGLSHVEELVYISQCSYVRCTEYACVQGKKSLQNLQEALKRGPSCLSSEDLHLLNLLKEHYDTCELPNCPVPWCRYICHRCPTKEGKTSQALMKLLSSPFLTLLPSSLQHQFDVFVKLDSSVGVERMPREWEEWLVLYSLSQSWAVARVTPLIPVWPHIHWVIKVASLHERKNQLEAYKKLRDLRHTHIVNHVWIAASCANKILVVCTEFLPGVSVRELLDQRVRLSSGQTCGYWLQVLSAVQRLHDLNILFLNWTCANLLLDDSCRTVKLTNFIASVELSSGNVDKESIKQTLPADIVPAELLVEGGELTHRTDSWGLACVLHEMLTGTRPWYHLRHGKHKDTWPQILKEVPPRLTTDLPSFAQFTIQGCLQKSPDCRPSVKDMMERCHSQCF